MEGYHESASGNDTPARRDRRVRRYESIQVSAFRLLADVIVDRLDIGDSFSPGVRSLARWAGLASAGQISTMLYEFANEGWIAYDGKTITLLADPDADDETPISAIDRDTDGLPINPIDRGESPPIKAIDHPINPIDRATSAELINGVDRSADRVPKRGKAFQTPINGVDRISRRMEDHVLVAAAGSQESAAALKHDLPCGAKIDQAADRLSPAAQALFDLGADDVIIADALAARPDLTVEQVAATWAHFEQRRRAGLVNGTGAFFNAIRSGQVHEAPPDPQRPIVAEEYTRQDPGFFRRGDDVSDLARPGAAPPAPEERPELRDLAPPVRAAPVRKVVLAPAYVPPKWRGRR